MDKSDARMQLKELEKREVDVRAFRSKKPRRPQRSDEKLWMRISICTNDGGSINTSLVDYLTVSRVPTPLPAVFFSLGWGATTSTAQEFTTNY